jgi:hypothetical protein
MTKIDVLTFIRDTGYRLSDLVAKVLPGNRQGLGWPEHKEPADLAEEERLAEDERLAEGADKERFPGRASLRSADAPAEKRGDLGPGE